MYITRETKFPDFLPLPRFLLREEHSLNAILIYTLLLGRMKLSQKNGWEDEEGNVYVIYPIDQIAKDFRRGTTTVKVALAELEKCGLIRRTRRGLSSPNHIYVLLPDRHDPDDQADEGASFKETDVCPSESQTCVLQADGRASTSNKSMSKENQSNMRGVIPRTPHGRYENVFLTEEEYEALRGEYWKIDELIEKLSAYMKSGNRKYADHAATLRLWLARDREKGIGVSRIPEYIPKEGESL